MSMEQRSSSEEDAVFQNEANSIIESAQKRGIILRLIGAIAIRYHLKTGEVAHANRTISDLDFIGLSKQRDGVEALLTELGYTPHERFNFVHGHQRLIFFNTKTDHRVDVFLDVFEMCHRFDFRDRLAVDDHTLSLADLIATKLQIVERNEKDIRDLFYIFREHEIGETDNDGLVNGKYLAQLCAKDWGIWKTFTMNLDGSMKYLDEFLTTDQDRAIVKSRIEKLHAMIDAEPKSRKWKLRENRREIQMVQST